MNFGKPVLLGGDKFKVNCDDSDDIFGSVTFQSPIQDLSVQEKEMLFSAAIATRATPVPAPRLSKTKQEEEKTSLHEENESDSEDIYEDLNELKFSGSKLYGSKYATSSKLSSNDSAKFSAPQVPPRNNFVIENPAKSSSSTKNNSYENVYCEIPPHQLNVDKSRLVENLMDKNDNGNLTDKNENGNLIDKNEKKCLENEAYVDITAQLGARPRKTR